MRLNLLNIGFGNFVIAGRIVAVISPGSAPVKRIKEVAKTKGLLVHFYFKSFKKILQQR